jgi:hypothetical protein
VRLTWEFLIHVVDGERSPGPAIEPNILQLKLLLRPIPTTTDFNIMPLLRIILTCTPNGWLPCSSLSDRGCSLGVPSRWNPWRWAVVE